MKTGKESENFLVAFCRDSPERVTIEFAKTIAGYTGVPYEVIFKDSRDEFRLVCYDPKKDEPIEEEEEEEDEPSDTPSPMSSPSPVKKPKACTCDHEVAANYMRIEGIQMHYFQKDRRFSNGHCRSCNKYFATDRNKKEGDYAERGSIPCALAWGCSAFVQGTNETCGTMKCDGCYIKMLGQQPRASRKRAANGGNKNVAISKKGRK